MIKNIVAVLGVALALVGCAVPQYIPLSSENAKKIQKVNARSVVIHDEVMAKADPLLIPVGGLIPALISASVTTGRQERLQIAMDAFYESVADYDFRAKYAAMPLP